MLQFESPIAGDTRPIADGLAKRARDMWRNLYLMEHNDPESVLYQKVCRKLCVVGYSAGGGAAMVLNSKLGKEEGLSCLIPMHPSFDNRQKTYSGLDVPILAGSGSRDEMTSQNVVWGMLDDIQPPVVMVTIKGGQHVQV